MNNLEDLRKEIVSLNEKMEYVPDATEIEDTINKWLAAQPLHPREGLRALFPYVKSDLFGYFEDFGATFEKHRVFLTKLFTAANNADGVNILLEYCRYYTHFIRQYKFDRHIDTGSRCECDHPKQIIGPLFHVLIKSNVTDKSIDAVWETLSLEAGYQDVYVYCRDDDSTAMVVMDGADLDAAVNALAASSNNYFRVTRLLIQEPVKEQFVKLIEERYPNQDDLLREIFIFRNNGEVIQRLNSQKIWFGVSIWTENVTAAKNLATSTELEVCIVWINSHGKLGVGISQLEAFYHFDDDHSRALKSSTAVKSSRAVTLKKEWVKRVDLFYNGKWQEPSEGKYWFDEETRIAHAQASKKDIVICVNAASSGYKAWRGVKLSKRMDIFRELAKRLRANGDSELADVVLKWIGAPLLYGSSLSVVGDGEADVLTTRRPIGFVFLALKNSVDVFAELTCACVAGNAVIVVSGDGCASISQYCDMFASCGIPAGVINSLSTDHIQTTLCSLYWNSTITTGRTNVESLKGLGKNWVDCCSKDSPYYDEMLYKHFTVPRFVWVPCK